MTTTQPDRTDKTMRVVSGSAGSFLCPPGHPMHRHAVQAGPKLNPNLIAGLDYALENQHGDVPEKVREAVQKLYDEATLIRSELWEREVYGYFRNSYSPDGIHRNVSKALPLGETGPDEHHLGFLTIREYFPDAEPRPDLIRWSGEPLYGARSCVKCAARIQYEAKFDVYCQVFPGFPEWRYVTDCPQGGTHAGYELRPIGKFELCACIDATCPGCGWAERITPISDPGCVFGCRKCDLLTLTRE